MTAAVAVARTRSCGLCEPPTSRNPSPKAHPACRLHPSGNRHLARALVLAARLAHPCECMPQPCDLSPCPCAGCTAFRAEARDALTVAGCIDDGGRELLPDDPRHTIHLEDVGTSTNSTGAGLDPYASPQRTAEMYRKHGRPNYLNTPPGLLNLTREASVTKLPASRKTRARRPSRSAPVPAAARPLLAPPEPPSEARSQAPEVVPSPPVSKTEPRRRGGPIPHGEPCGYSMHRRRGVPFPEDAGAEPCGCRAAAARRQAEYVANRARHERTR